MPSTRLVRVARAIMPEDLNICDMARDSKGDAPGTKAEKFALK